MTHPVYSPAAADPADVFGQRGTQDAQLGSEASPNFWLPADAGLRRGAALVQVVADGKELRQAVAQQFLLFSQIEVHLQPQCRFGENISLNFVAAGVN